MVRNVNKMQCIKTINLDDCSKLKGVRTERNIKKSAFD